MTTEEIDKICKRMEDIDSMNKDDKRMHAIADFMHNVLGFDSDSIHFVNATEFDAINKAYDAILLSLRSRLDKNII